ncbi:MAG: histidine kinase [Segetibacter sp.]
MTSQQFIFSNNISHRLTRHGVFWLIFALQLFLFRYYVFDLKYLTYSSTYLIRYHNTMLFLPASIFYAYFSIYYLLPRYILKDRYGSLIIIVLLFCIVLLLLSYLISTSFNIRLAWDIPLNRSSITRQMDFAVNNGLIFPLTVSGFGIGIKMSKNFYLQQKQNEELARQKTTAEVLLMKSQIHPRFLFHSLNSIYNDMCNGSEKSPGMLLNLSDLLSYILYESDEKIVPLEKELTLLQNYIDLEKVTWGNRLVINMDKGVKAGEKFIAPLLLLPIAEYIFEKADRDKQREISLTINMQLEESKFSLSIIMKGNTQSVADAFENSTQMLQLRKRIQTIYKNKHHFAISESKDVINIFLSLLLDDRIE